MPEKRRRRRRRRRRKPAPPPRPPAPPHPSLAALVQQLIQRRLALGLSQADLDAKIGTPAGLVGKWEAGLRRPTGQCLAEWAQALGCHLLIADGQPPQLEPMPRPRNWTGAWSHQQPGAFPRLATRTETTT